MSLKSNILSSIFAGTCLTTAAGCLVAPLDGTAYKVSESKEWSGFVSTPNSPVSLRVEKCGGGWSEIRRGNSAHSPTDLHGTTAYKFNIKMPSLIASSAGCDALSDFGCNDLDVASRSKVHGQALFSSGPLYTFTQPAYDKAIAEYNKGASGQAVLEKYMTGSSVVLSEIMPGETKPAKYSTWVLDINELRVDKHEEQGSIVKDPGDEPIVLFVPFRASLVNRKAKVVMDWNGVVRQLGNNVTTGRTVGIADDNGRIHFPNVGRTAGNTIDVAFGVAMIAIEGDSTDRSVIRKLVRNKLASLRGSMESKLQTVLQKAIAKAKLPNEKDLAALSKGISLSLPEVWDAVNDDLGSILENGLEFAVGADSDFFGSQVLTWLALPVPSGTKTTKIRTLKAETFKSTRADIAFDGRQDYTYRWRLGGRFFNWTDDLIKKGAKVCGERPYGRFSALPQVIGQTAFSPNTAVPGSVGKAR